MANRGNVPKVAPFILATQFDVVFSITNGFGILIIGASDFDGLRLVIGNCYLNLTCHQKK